jgi:hypothetical protein
MAALGWQAQPASAAELLLDDSASCTSADELSFRVQRLLGRPLAEVHGMLLSVRIESTREGYDARLDVARLGANAGTRSLDATTCEELSESLALAIVVAIGTVPEPAEVAPASTAFEALEPQTPAVMAVKAPVDAPVKGPAAPSRVDTESGPRLGGTAWMIGDTGTLPAPGVGVAIGISAAWPSLELRAIATWLPEREGTRRTFDAGSPSVSIGLVAGTAIACVPFSVTARALRLVACGGWEVGQLSGSGTHVSVSYHQRRLWSAARLDLAGRWALESSALGVELLITAAAPFTRDDFVVDDFGSLHRPANVVGRLGLGLSLLLDR